MSASLGIGVDGNLAECDSTVVGTFAELVDCDASIVTAISVDIE